MVGAGGDLRSRFQGVRCPEPISAANVIAVGGASRRARRLLCLPQTCEERANVRHQQVGCFEGGKVAACVDVTPVDDVVLGENLYTGRTGDGVGQSCPCIVS